MICSFDEIKPKYYDSISEYRKEFLAEKSSFDGCSNLEKYENIEKWHLNCKLFENESTLPPGYSIGYQYLYVNNNVVIGMINFRPNALSHPYLSKFGGHIGYSVKINYRNEGIGTKMLSDFLILCKDKNNLDKVLITCFEDNIGSQKIITSNGGIFESKIFYTPENKYLYRYWIEL